MFDPVTMYAIQVVQGDIVAGPHVRASCQRHLSDLDREDIYFSTDAMQYVFDFFEQCLVLADGQFDGVPFRLHPSQQFIIGSIFGWKRRSSDLRRFNRAYIEQAKGNGKTPTSGGIGLFGLIADGEKAAQIYAAASSRDQADILFQDAVRMVKQSEMLSAAIDFTGNSKIYAMTANGARQAGSIFRPLAKTAGTRGSGLRPHMALCDELHEHPDRSVVDMLERGFKFRRQPLLVMITNSGTDRNSVCWEEHVHAVNVAHGETDDDSTFSYVCALDDGDDPFQDETCWVKANPLLGTILTHDYLRGVVNQAKSIPGRQNNILRLHFCTWTDAEKAWVTRAAWEACEDRHIQLDDFAGQECVVGLDLSSTKDLSARALVFDDGMVEADDGQMLPKFVAFVHGYTPRATLRDRELADKAPYSQWVEQGFITATPGPVIRFGHIIRDLIQDQNLFDLKAVAYDRYLVPRFETDCQDIGAEFPMVEHPQGWNRRKHVADTESDTSVEMEGALWMPGSVDLLETLILEKRLRVQLNPALRSAVASAMFVTSPAGLRRFDKQNVAQRIDMLVALTMAIGAAHAHIEPVPTGTVHEQRGRELLAALQRGSAGSSSSDE